MRAASGVGGNADTMRSTSSRLTPLTLGVSSLNAGTSLTGFHACMPLWAVQQAPRMARSWLAVLGHVSRDRASRAALTASTRACRAISESRAWL